MMAWVSDALGCNKAYRMQAARDLQVREVTRQEPRFRRYVG
jgi:hypothetical protein